MARLELIDYSSTSAPGSTACLEENLIDVTTKAFESFLSRALSDDILLAESCSPDSPQLEM